MAMAGQQEPLRQTEVSQQMIALGEELGVLTGVLSDLEGRLGSVLSEMPSEKEAAPPVPRPRLCGHAEDIRVCVGKVEAVTTKLRSLYNRLEV